MMNLKIAVLLLSSYFLATFADSAKHLIWPWPQEYTQGELNADLTHPCKLKLKVLNTTVVAEDMQKMFEEYKAKTLKRFQCDPNEAATEKEMIEGHNILMVEFTENVTTMYNLNASVENERYDLEITVNQSLIRTKTYVGFLRGLETFFQILNCSGFDETTNKRKCSISHIPIKITDYPTFPHRGIMVDTSRHFYPKEALMKLFDGMVHAKLSVFHWHITDTDSFPLYLTKFPKITEYGAFSADEIYTVEDVKEIVRYAGQRGIRVIPEIDTPSHTLSWGFSPDYKDIILCQGDGVIDPTNEKTIKILDAIWEEILEIYPDSYVHFGIDEVPLGCWSSLVKNTGGNNNGNNQDALLQLARDYKQSLKNRTLGKTTMIWFRNSESFAYQPDEILHYWDGSYSVSNTLQQWPNNSFVLSPMDVLYLDCGTGNAFGDGSWCGEFHGWSSMYSFDPIGRVDKAHIHQVLGAEACLWSERSNADVLEARIWPRVLAMAERFWSNSSTTNMAQAPKMSFRFNNMVKHIRQHGIQSGPITSGWCERSGGCI